MFLAAASQTTAKPPPPRPLDTGWVTPIASIPATAASAAEPPFSSTSMAIRAAVAFSEATAKRCAFTAGGGGSGVAEALSSGPLSTTVGRGAAVWTAGGGKAGGGSPQPAGKAKQ